MATTISATLGAMSPQKTRRNPLGAGRNPRAGEPANARITLRLTEAEHASYTAAAQAAGMPLVVWVRDACEARLPKRKVRR